MSPMKDVSLYPANWPQISMAIRQRSEGQCECRGHCGLHHDRRCLERQGEPAKWAKGKVMLTVAHLDHDPPNVAEENLLAMCQRCHLRYDRFQHAENSRETRLTKKEATQPILFGREFPK
jgi:hypothetical protein